MSHISWSDGIFSTVNNVNDVPKKWNKEERKVLDILSFWRCSASQIGNKKLFEQAYNRSSLILHFWYILVSMNRRKLLESKERLIECYIFFYKGRANNKCKEIRNLLGQSVWNWRIKTKMAMDCKTRNNEYLSLEASFVKIIPTYSKPNIILSCICSSNKSSNMLFNFSNS